MSVCMCLYVIGHCMVLHQWPSASRQLYFTVAFGADANSSPCVNGTAPMDKQIPQHGWL